MPKRRYTYRILYAPATLGALAFLLRNENDWPKIKQGLVLALLGDKGRSTYKKSRLGNTKVDRLAAHVLKQSGAPFEVRDFIPFGYDERQFNSPGIDLPMGCLMRTPNGEFAEYHTCADNLEFIKAASLADSLGKVLAIVDGFERDARYLNLSPKGEPRLGKRGLYQGLKKSWIPAEAEMALFWVLSYSDGAHSLLDIAERAQLPFGAIADAAQLMLEANLLKSLSEDSSERLGRMSP